ncbi:MAG TPA: hypothetical protein PLA12_02715 [Candidatus Hydrogenedens sp.]|nr:hypothetical protein [Candidatus Hydrogenedens sp.]
MLNKTLSAILVASLIVVVSGCSPSGDLTKAMANAGPLGKWIASLQIGVSPRTVTFTKQDVQEQKAKNIRVWDRFPFGGKIDFTVVPKDNWVTVSPVQGSSAGPWDRVSVEVKVSTSVLETSETALPLDSLIEIKTADDITKNVKVNVVEKGNVAHQIRERIRERLEELFGRIRQNQHEGNPNQGNQGGNQ